MAATDVEKLVVALEARTKAFENALNRANGVANSRARAIETRFARLNKTMTAGFNAAGNAAAKAFALIGGTAGAKSLSDAATRIDNSLKVAGLSGEELERVYQALFASATKNAAPLETLVGLYGKAAQNQKELGVTSAELLTFTDNVALALRVAGTDAQSASGALLQLGQALGSGKVQAEEFNSVLEGAPTIVQAVAAGLKEAGGSVSQLKKLVIDGKISSEAFFRAFEAGAPILQQKVAGSVYTIDQRLTNLQTALVNAAREFNESSKAGETFGEAIDGVAKFVNSVNFDSLITQIQQVSGVLSQAVNMTNTLYEAIGGLAGLDKVGKGLVDLLPGDGAKKSFLGGGLTIQSNTGITDRINQAFEGQIEKAGDLTADAIKKSVLGGTSGAPVTTTPKASRVPKSVTPVSIKDFKAPVGSGSGGGKGSKSQNDYQREVQQIKDRTAAVLAETAAMAKLDPLVDDFGYSLDAARSKQDLLTAAQQAGVKITPEVQASIEAMANSYASATAAADRLAATQEKARERAEFFAQTTFDAFSELIPQIETGNKALDGFLNTLIQAVAQAALLGKGPLAAPGGGGGLLGTLFGGLKLFGLAKGGVVANGKPMKRFAGGGVSRSASIFGEAGPEAAVPLPDGRRIPVDLRMPARGSGSSQVILNYSPTVDLRGASQDAVVRLERTQREQSKNFEKMVDARLNARSSRKTRA